jgi:tetratricopeptide (TPR) repeat protein
MQYQEYMQEVELITKLIKDANYNEAVDALFQLILSDISDIDKAALCAQLAVVFDRLRNEKEALAYFDKGISFEQNWCRYEVTEKKAQYLSQLGRSDQAVPIYESLLKQPFISESEKDRMRKTLQTFLRKTIGSWQ